MAELPQVHPSSERSGPSGEAVEHNVVDTVKSSDRVQVSLLPPGFSSPISARFTVNARDIVFDEIAMKKVGRLEMLLLDLLGVLVRPQDDGSCTLQLHMFAYSKMTKRGLVRTSGRRHEVFTVVFPRQGEQQKDSRAMAEEWKARLLDNCSQRCRDIFVYEPVCGGRVEGGMHPRHPHYLVLVNPTSGKGMAEVLFKKQVQPLFDIAEITYDIVVTKQAGHARELVREYNISSIDGIVISSGDGLLYEVVNGLMEREDWDRVISIPIGILPTGSGNALCASTLHESREDCNLENAAFQIIRGGIAPMDLALTHTPSGTTYFNLLMSWGIIADVDIESEKWRSLGEVRFTMGSLISLAKKKLYHGRLWYLPVEGEDSGENMSTKENQTAEGQVAMQQEGEQLPKVNVPCSSEEEGQAEEGESGSVVPQRDAEGEEVKVTTNTPPVQLEDDLSKGSDMPQAEGGGQKPAQLLKLKPAHLPELSAPPPDSWKCIEGEFWCIIISLTSHMAQKMHSTPMAELGSGAFHIFCVPASVSRMELLGIMTKLDTGQQANHPKVICLKGRAFRFEPVTFPGHLTLDGEMIDYAAVQAEAVKGACRVLCRKQRPVT